MRYWHLLFGTIFIYLAAHITLGVPDGIASLGRWGLLAGTAGMSTWLLVFSGRAGRFSGRTGGVGTVLLFLYGLLLATALAGFQVRLSVLKWLLLGTHLFVFVFAANRLLSLRQWSHLAGALFLLFAVPIVVTFIAALTGFSPILSSFGVYYQGRLAVLGNPNSVGMVVLAGGVTALWVQEWPTVAQKWSRRAIPLFVIGASTLVLLWTGSRSALGGFVLGAIIWAVATGKGGKSIGLGLLGGIVLWVWSLDVSTFDTLGIIVERLQTGTLLDTRDSVWTASLRNWREHPWFGHGYGVTDGGYTLDGLTGAVGSVRDGSGYFGVLESVGVVGVLGLLTLYAVVARNLWHLWAHWGGHRRPDWILAMLGGSLFFGFAVNAVGEPWLLGPGSFPHIVFWCALGLHVAGTARVRSHKAKRHRQRSPVGSPTPSRMS
ncbi:O-antigen ligase family protein [Salinibacter sp.]|uniref:O-antigen ligase family protein n=1 Tax=Salinibacter sp. TaxID=2065818 RepID=UPI0021E85D4D|nr:hypothetical protein [Salinibacter sp.]